MSTASGASANGWMRFANESGDTASTIAEGKRTPQGVYAFRQSSYSPEGQRLAGSALGEVKDDYESKNAERAASQEAARDQKAIYG